MRHGSETGTTRRRSLLNGHGIQASEQSPTALRAPQQGLSCLWPAVQLAEEVGAGLGEREVLLGSVSGGGGEVEIRATVQSAPTSWKAAQYSGPENPGLRRTASCASCSARAFGTGLTEYSQYS